MILKTPDVSNFPRINFPEMPLEAVLSLTVQIAKLPTSGILWLPKRFGISGQRARKILVTVTSFPALCGIYRTKRKCPTSEENSKRLE